MSVSQVSLQTGVLAPAIATASIFDPIISVALGVTLFEESLHDDAVGVAASIAALGVMFAGLIVLARSEGARHEPDAPASARRVSSSSGVPSRGGRARRGSRRSLRRRSG
jgi:hypothetical protein